MPGERILEPGDEGVDPVTILEGLPGQGGEQDL